MGRFSRLGNSLYEGDVSVDFVGRKYLWYAVSAVIIALATFGLLGRGLQYGIEFTGGVEYRVSQLPASQANQSGVTTVRQAVVDTGIAGAEQPIVNTSGANGLRVQTKSMPNADSDRINQSIQKALGVAPQQISESAVGASYGSQVAKRSLTGLVVFLILVVLFIWAYFRQWKMSVAALVALAHDVLITVGVYALVGFEVTPATVTGVLTILGFSLYDTVVVFDKIRENTKDLRRSRRTYAELANLALNQTLVRSINTSFVALLPVGSLLAVGALTLGSGALKDLSLSLFIGMAAGAYSSIFIATPLLVQLKSSEKEITEQDARARARARRGVDRYADVPVFTDDMPVEGDPDSRGARSGSSVYADHDDHDHDPAPDEERDEPARTAPPRRPEASGSGRTLPSPKSPMRPSGASKRSQPTRQPRSRRGR